MASIDSCLALETAPGKVDIALRYKWHVLLGLAILGLGVFVLVFTMTVARRNQALRLLDARGIKYEFADDNEWMTDYFGSWARPFRSVRSITVPDGVPDAWQHIMSIHEVETLDVPGWMLGDGTLTEQTVRRLNELPELKTIVTDWVRDDGLRATLKGEWTVVEMPVGYICY